MIIGACDQVILLMKFHLHYYLLAGSIALKMSCLNTQVYFF